MKRKVEAQLIAWKNKSSERQPLLVNGARQVGKTYILRKFGEEQFKNVVYVNLETNLTIASYFNDNIAPERLLRYLEASTGERIIAGETLIFFDEIQSCERALTSLKYFCEETPEFHIAAAGSLLGVAINRQHYSFPVGKVETITMYPLDFEEFLWALDNESLMDFIKVFFEKKKPLGAALHRKAMDYFRQYMIVGGMPQAVERYVETKDFERVDRVKRDILELYRADIVKHAQGYEMKVCLLYTSDAADE